MRMTRTSITNWLWMMAAFGVSGAVAPAQTPKGQPVNVMLALDNSGSMKQNDPKGLVKQAAAEFARRLPAEGRLGIVIFDQHVDLAMSLTKVSDPEFTSRLAQTLSRVDYSGKWTDIPGGIERAIYSLNHDGRPDALHSVVFFTDGIVETGDRAKDLDRSKWLRENLAAEAKQHGIRIFGVAFTEGADYELIQAVAQTTGGEHYRVLNSSDIAGAFERIGKQVMQRLPISMPQTSSSPGLPPAQGGPRYWVAFLVGLALLGLLVVMWLRRGGMRSSAPLESQDVPIADVAHLIDVGGHSGAQRIPIRKRRIRIGRDAKLNDVSIAETTMSSQHASIEFRDGFYFLRDLRSANGTFVNGKRMSDPDAVREVQLKSGDRIRFDAYEFIFDLDALSGGAPSAGGIVPEVQRTRLRSEAPPPGLEQQPHPVSPPKANAAPAPTIQKPAAAPAIQKPAPAPTIQKPAPSPNAPAATVVKNKYCPTHSSWLATELCPKCGVGKCKQCMVENTGSQICLDCANAGRNLT